jgi:sensor c-di-GMP phosphodiesterase-like protein
MIEWSEIAAGLEQDEFFLEYLPTMHLADRVCVGAEALIRWRRPTGVVSPLEFIPLIENTSLSADLTYWVIERIAQEMRQWLHESDHVHISFNVPPEILGRGGLDYAGKKTGLDHVVDKIIVEITERSLPDQIGVVALERLQLRATRPQIALDDVGLGSGNLIVLSRVYVDYLKLDKSIVEQIQPGAPLPNLLQQLAALRGQSEIKVIAEGIETADQVAVLLEAGVLFGQGWFFSPPLSASAFRQFFDLYRLANC